MFFRYIQQRSNSNRCVVLWNQPAVKSYIGGDNNYDSFTEFSQFMVMYDKTVLPTVFMGM